MEALAGVPRTAAEREAGVYSMEQYFAQHLAQHRNVRVCLFTVAQAHKPISKFCC